MRSERDGEGRLDGPPGSKTLAECPEWHLKFPCPIREELLTPVVLNELVVSPVSTLLINGGPATVPRFIIPPWIREAIDRMLVGGTIPHIRQERRETLPPPITDDDTLCAVPRVIVVRRSMTPVDHGPPDPVQGRMRLSVCRVRLLRLLSLVTAAGRGFPQADVRPQGGDDLPASTPTDQRDGPRGCRRPIGRHGQSTIGTSDVIPRLSRVVLQAARLRHG